MSTSTSTTLHYCIFKFRSVLLQIFGFCFCCCRVQHFWLSGRRGVSRRHNTPKIGKTIISNRDIQTKHENKKRKINRKSSRWCTVCGTATEIAMKYIISVEVCAKQYVNAIATAPKCKRNKEQKSSNSIFIPQHYCAVHFDRSVRNHWPNEWYRFGVDLQNDHIRRSNSSNTKYERILNDID